MADVFRPPPNPPSPLPSHMFHPTIQTAALDEETLRRRSSATPSPTTAVDAEGQKVFGKGTLAHFNVAPQTPDTIAAADSEYSPKAENFRDDDIGLPQGTLRRGAQSKRRSAGPLLEKSSLPSSSNPSEPKDVAQSSLVPEKSSHAESSSDPSNTALPLSALDNDSSGSSPGIVITAATLPRGTLGRGTLRRNSPSRRGTGDENSGAGADGGTAADNGGTRVHLAAPPLTATAVPSEFAQALRGGASTETASKRRSFWDLKQARLAVKPHRKELPNKIDSFHPANENFNHTQLSNNSIFSSRHRITSTAPLSPSAASETKISATDTPLSISSKPSSRVQSGMSFWKLSGAHRVHSVPFDRESHGSKQRYSTRIKDYELLSQIGGVDDLSFLYLARHLPNGELVALKYTDLTISPDFELIEEVIVSLAVVLPYHTSFVEHDRLWSVTHPIRGGSCKQIMREYFPDGFGFKESVVATIVKEVVKGIEYMHSNYVMHNDIRASSILLCHTGNVLLTGLHASLPLLQSGLLHRSLFVPVGDNHEHCAPEIIAQAGRVGPPADVYSIGLATVELAFGKTMFDGWPGCKILLCKITQDCPAPDIGSGWAGVGGMVQDEDQADREREKEEKALAKGSKAGFLQWGARRKGKQAGRRRKLAIGKGMSFDFWKFVECCTRRDPKKRPTATELLEHPFLARARDAKHVQKHVLKPSGLVQRHDSAIRASAAAAASSHSSRRHSSSSSSRRSSTASRRRDSGASRMKSREGIGGVGDEKAEETEESDGESSQDSVLEEEVGGSGDLDEIERAKRMWKGKKWAGRPAE
ncbi:hypothetical protein HDU93_000694 [Gonapodya sp. JEL0774]|nr:hypothetical protein HDU93_000694 [Gonapodya sp. JEL0774]